MQRLSASTRPSPIRLLGPGLSIVALGVAGAWMLNLIIPSVSVLMFALVLGALVTNTGASPAAAADGIRFAGKRLLRAGVVMLGFQLSISDMLGLGWATLMVIVLTVVTTFATTVWLGGRLGLSRDQTLLIATGVSICGASAVAAMSAVTDAEEDDVMSTVALVTLYGTGAILVLPALAAPLALEEFSFGVWAGASVHEVAQVVATASVVGATALAPAVVVKLTRVVLLGPLVAAVSLWRRREVPSGPRVARSPLVPLFVVGFLAAMGLRSTGYLPPKFVDIAAMMQLALLAAGMFGLGASVRPKAMLRGSARGLLLGLLATAAITAVSLAGVLALV